MLSSKYQHRSINRFLSVLLLCILTIITTPLSAATNWDVYEKHVLDVKFRDGTQIRAENGHLRDSDRNQPNASEISGILSAIQGGQWLRGNSVPDATLQALRAKGRARSGKNLPDLSLYQRLILPPGLDAERAKTILQRFTLVEAVHFVPKPTPSPVAPDYSLNTTSPYQNYFDPAPGGINVGYADSLSWNGQNVSICDVEYNLNVDHADLPAIKWLGEVNSDPFNDTNHGTAVIGIMASLDDGIGTRGIAHLADSIFFSPANTVDYGYSVARALVECIAALEPGDVILIEQQTVGPNYTGSGSQFGLVPTEWDKPVYDAIRTAVANDIIVVETTGNGSQNLDSAVYSQGHDNHWPFLAENDSGAILVTGGASTLPHSDLWYTNYGSTVDLQGWGQNIVTTGYGDLYSDDGVNSWYTTSFGGSSGAGPIVTASVAAIQGGYKALTGTNIPPAQMRSILRTTGTDGGGNLVGVPLPDLEAAINSILDVIYVDDTATGTNNGSSWTDAYTWLPDALAAASSGSIVMVAEGYYFPAYLDGSRTNTFSLINGVAILGGYPNGGGERDPVNHATYLSGNIDSNSTYGSAGDAYHVVSATGNDATAILDGFHILGGNADGTSPHDKGAGVYVDGGSPTIRNTWVSNNGAVTGGGIYTSNSSVSFVDVIIENNTSSSHGGGLYNSSGDIRLNRVTFINNTASGASAEGGGLFTTGNGSAGTTPLFYDVRFYGNSAFRGGAIANWPGSELIIENAIFSANNAADIGGAIINFGTDTTLNINNATFANNTAPNGGGVIYAFQQATINNSILWGNSASQVGGTTAINNSVVQGGAAGTNNTSGDPLFRDADGADNTLGTTDDDLRLAGLSPAIDSAGSDCTGTDIRGHNRIGACDRGANEYLGDSGTFWSNGEVDNRFVSHSYDQTLNGGPIRQSADDFSIAPDEACDVTSIRSVLADDTDTLQAKLEIYTDNSGKPGSLIQSYNTGVSPGESLGALNGAPLWQYQFDISPLRLQAGTYWVSIYGQQELNTGGISTMVSSGEGNIKGNPSQFREAGFSWVDAGIFGGSTSTDLALDVDATCGCATNHYCDDGNVDTVDACSNLMCTNVIPPPPGNDDISNAIVVTEGNINGTLLGASNDGSSSVGTAGAKDVWFQYTVSISKRLALTTCGTNDATGLDTTIAVYSDASGSVSSEIIANDDWPSSITYPNACEGLDTGELRDSALIVDLTEGETVYIRVAQYSTATNGDFTLDISNATDADADGVLDNIDNCPLVSNPTQADTDLDGTGDACQVGITGIWPADASIGDTASVFVFGQNFTTDNSTEVYFNGIRQWLIAPVTTDMLIARLTVSESLFGPVTITTPSDTETSTQYFGSPLTGLNLTGVWPSNPPIGESSSVFLFGTEFTTDNTTEVYFNGVRQYLVAPVSNDMLIVRVIGDNSLSGIVTVVTPSGTVNSVEPLIFGP